jgi:DNA-binding Lrp family transcriptional regulator
MILKPSFSRIYRAKITEECLFPYLLDSHRYKTEMQYLLSNLPRSINWCGCRLADALDELDKKILHEICSGISSYDDLAKTLNVTRGTIYRRIDKLEKNSHIKKKIMAIPNYDALSLSAICIGMEVAYDHMEKAAEALQQFQNIKLLWKSYGAHNLVAIIVCEKGKEGETITNLRQIIANLDTSNYHISVGFKWDKVDISPY